MAFSLGTLVINLTASTASFVEGMTKAGQHVQKTAKQMEESLSNLGGLAEKVLAPFGEIGETIARSLDVAGQAIGSTTKMLGGLAEGMGGIVGLAGGAVVAIGAMGLGLAGIAAWASKGAAQLQELSEKTGVSVEMLSALGYAGKQSGVNIDSLGSALEKLSKSAFAAATAPAGAVTAYDRLGISVRDAHGAIKPASELLDEIADRFSHMQDGTAKTALAMQIFGRAGAEMIPMLNKGRDGIAELTNEASLFGVTISGDTAKQAKEFQDSIDRIEGALMGVANALMKELLPSLNAGINYILDLLHDGNNGFTVFTTAIKYGVESIIVAFKAGLTAEMALIEGIDYLGSVAKNSMSLLGGLFGGAASAFERLKNHDFKGAAQALKDGWRIGAQDFVSGVEESGKNISDRLTKLYAGLWFGMDTGKQHPEAKKDFSPDMSASDKANHPDFVAARIKQLEQQAAAMGKLAIATDRTTSAENANAAANEANKVITDLTIEAEKQKGKYRLQFLSEIQQQTDKIKALVAATLAFKEANQISDELQKQNEKLQDSTNGIKARTAALLAGGNAINQALAEEKIAPYERAVSEDTKRLDELRQMHGATAQEIQRASQAVAEANSELDTHRKLLQDNIEAEARFRIASELSAPDQQREQIAQLKEFAKTANLTAEQQLMLNDKIVEGEKQQIQQYDALLLKTNDYKNGITAFFNELSLQGKNSAKDIYDSLSSTFDQLSQHLTNFIVKGQFGLQQLAQSIEQDFIGKMVKNSLANSLSKLSSHFGLGGLGSVSKPDGSTEQNALWVQFAGNGLLAGSENPLSKVLGLPSAKPSGPDNGTTDLMNSMKGMFSKLTDSFGSLFSQIGNVLGSVMKGAGGIFSGIAGLFGGFMANGGDVQPGKAYIVGERHAELFKPNSHGRIEANPSMNGNGRALIFSPQYNINTPNPDSFRKSQSQIIAEGYAAAALAHARNR